MNFKLLRTRFVGKNGGNEEDLGYRIQGWSKMWPSFNVVS